MLSEEKIKDEYKKFDESYEKMEISPYNAAYDYYRAGVKMAEEHYKSNKNKMTVDFIDNVGAYQTLTVDELVDAWKEIQANEIKRYRGW